MNWAREALLIHIWRAIERKTFKRKSLCRKREKGCLVLSHMNGKGAASEGSIATCVCLDMWCRHLVNILIKVHMLPFAHEVGPARLEDQSFDVDHVYAKP